MKKCIDNSWKNLYNKIIYPYNYIIYGEYDSFHDDKMFLRASSIAISQKEDLKTIFYKTWTRLKDEYSDKQICIEDVCYNGEILKRRIDIPWYVFKYEILDLCHKDLYRFSYQRNNSFTSSEHYKLNTNKLFIEASDILLTKDIFETYLDNY